MAEVKRIWTVGGERALNPAHIAKTASEYNWPMRWHGLVNGLSCPRGRPFGEAHFLLSQESLDALDLTGPIDLEIEHEDGTIVFPGYYVTRTQAVSRDVNKPPHWVTLSDRRYIYERISAAKRYNLRVGPNDSWYVETTNAGTPYTWQEIIDDLWTLLPASAGSAPTIASAPTSTPENFDFQGLSAWRAINQVLTAIGRAIVYDPISEVFTEVKLTDTQSGLVTLQLANDDRILWNFRPEATAEINYPKEVEVLFPMVPGGGESPWLEAADLEVAEVDADGFDGMKWPITDTMFSWDDNSTERTARAEEIADALKGLLRAIAEPWGIVYAGALEFKCGSEVTEVQWLSDGERGMRTIVRHCYSEIDWPTVPEMLGGGETIEYVITSAARETSGPYDGLMKATVNVKCGPAGMIGQDVSVYDHSDGLFDEADMAGYTGWAFWGQAWSLDEGDPCETLTPPHWIAMNRVCSPNTGIYADPC